MTTAPTTAGRIGIVTFPGTLGAEDASRAVELSGAQAVQIWHDDATLPTVDALILPAGNTYGDYLRAGALATTTAIAPAIVAAAQAGVPVLGIGNGFQILCELGLLPGALVANESLTFTSRTVTVEVDNAATPWTSDLQAGDELALPVNSGAGQYVADEATLDALEENGQVVLRYASENPNGSARDIAGVANEAGNVVGIMVHPEYAIEAGFGPSLDGQAFFTSVFADYSAAGDAADETA